MSAATDPRFAATAITGEKPAAAVCLGLVVYVRGELTPHWDGLLRAWDAYAATPWAAGARFLRSWDADEWRELSESAGLGPARQEIVSAAGSRPFWRFQVANREVLPDTGFEFRDVRESQGRERASYLRIRLPMDADPAALKTLFLSVAEALPAWSGTAGYQFVHLEQVRDHAFAFDQVWAWSRRYWGVEVVELTSGSWDALHGLSSVNWLTLLGTEFAEEKLPGLGDAGGAVEQVPSAAGVVLQAGPAPILGDLNRMEDLSRYTEVARLVEGAMVEDPSPWLGMFTDHESTKLWQRRFLEPGPWMDPDLA